MERRSSASFIAIIQIWIIISPIVFTRSHLKKTAQAIQKSAFKSYFDYSIDPALNRIKRAKFTAMGLADLLDKYDITIEN